MMPVTPIAYYDFDFSSNGYTWDALGGVVGRYYYKNGDSADRATSVPTSGAAPMAGGATSVAFNGYNSFAYIPHSSKLEVQNGTIGLWVNPNTVLGEQIFVLRQMIRRQGNGQMLVRTQLGQPFQ